MKLLESLIQVIKEQDVKTLKGERDAKIQALKDANKKRLEDDKVLSGLKKELEVLRKEYKSANVTTMDEKPPMYGGSISTREDVRKMKENIKAKKGEIKAQIKNINDSYKAQIRKIKDNYNKKIKLSKKNLQEWIPSLAKKLLKKSGKSVKPQTDSKTNCNVGNKCTVALNCKGTSTYHGILNSNCECDTPNGTYSSGWIDCGGKKIKTKEVTKKEAQSAVDAINSFIYGQLLGAKNYTQKKMKQNLEEFCPDMKKIMEKSAEEMPFIFITYEALDGFHEVIATWIQQGQTLETLERAPIHVKDCDFVKNVSETEFEDNRKELLRKIDLENEEIRKKNEASAQERKEKRKSPPAYDPR